MSVFSRQEYVFWIIGYIDDNGYMRWNGETIWRGRGFHALRAFHALLVSPVMFPFQGCNQCAQWVLHHRPFLAEMIAPVGITFKD